jgi:mono/diheme cytochrome c family protein
MSSNTRSAALVIAALLVGGAVAIAAIAWRPATAAIEPPAPSTFNEATVKRGRELAAIGNCASCHTAGGGQDFAGGRPVPTPFGTIFSTNISPDATTGIGRWSEAAFLRAMHEGVDRGGHHLYPTFPYDHFTHVSEADDQALYAYLMTRPAVYAPARDNQLAFPLNQRVVIAGWKLLFFRSGSFQPDPAHSAEWNLGAYLVEGLAHCGACHTPRNALGAERDGDRFGGGDSEHWRAYAINAQSPAPVPWTAKALTAYLGHGWQKEHGVAGGPMAAVVDNLADVPQRDIGAIAAYMEDQLGKPTAEQQHRAADALAPVKPPIVLASNPDAAGAAIYDAACAGCHEGDRSLPYGGVNLALTSALGAPDPRNAVNTILAGIRPAADERGPIMPGFAATMTDAQIAALLRYLRVRFSDQPAWSDVESSIKAARRVDGELAALRGQP